MAEIRNVVVIGDGPVKSDAGIHGYDLGYIWAYGNVALSVDYATLHDGWVKIVNPPVWKETGKAGWVKWSRCAVDDPTITKILIEIKDGVVTAKIVG